MANGTRLTLDTKFHIDFDWWEEQDLDFRLYLHHQLCPEHQKAYNHRVTEMIDWVDPNTAEVKRVDALWQSLQACCSQRPDYITESTPLITAVFRVFLANGNTPLSAKELAEKIGHTRPEVILRTLTRGKVYRGIKPLPSKS